MLVLCACLTIVKLLMNEIVDFWIHQESPVCEVIISSPFVAKIKYNGGVLFVCIFVKLME